MIGNSPVKDGYLTSVCLLRARHVKCDENKPYCKRCPATGWQCDGYSDPNVKATREKKNDTTIKTLVPRPTDLILAPKLPMEVPTMPNRFENHQEEACFNHFRTTTVAQLAGSFNAALWTPVVLQACEAEPQIFHAAIASMRSCLYSTNTQPLWGSYTHGTSPIGYKSRNGR